MRRWIFLLMLLLSAGLTAQAQTLELAVDATDASRGLFHTRLTVPASAGPLTLSYPKWIPGDHAPDGPIVNLTGVRFWASGSPIAWKRDPYDMFSFIVEAPEGAASIEATLDFISPPNNSASPKLAILNWNEVLLYPKGARASQLQAHASVQLPPGWTMATALPIVQNEGGQVDFAPVSLETLIDSPVLSGEYFKTYDLGENHFLDVAADSPDDLELKPAQLDGMKRLVAETKALFGARPYRQYHFLLALSDVVAHYGLEHHESSDDRAKEDFFTDDDAWLEHVDLLTHEFTHSWNGKFRRPQGLLITDYQTDYDTNLLWCYEGLTEYLAMVLASRSGLRTTDRFEQNLARSASWASHRMGRTWRSLGDVTASAQLLYNAPGEWDNWRRETDFYEEGILLWLEIDVRIRTSTQGARSLDDFCKLFHGAGKGYPEVLPYTREDVVAALHQVAPDVDWPAFLAKKIDQPVPASELAALELGGWKLVYKSERSEAQKSVEGVTSSLDFMPSLGLKLDDEGKVDDVLWGGLADQAGFVPGMKIIAVNGRSFSEDRLRKAIGRKGESMDLLVEQADFYKTISLQPPEGERYPYLERDDSKPDLLAKIAAPLAR